MEFFQSPLNNQQSTSKGIKIMDSLILIGIKKTITKINRDDSLLTETNNLSENMY